MSVRVYRSKFFKNLCLSLVSGVPTSFLGLHPCSVLGWFKSIIISTLLETRYVIVSVSGGWETRTRNRHEPLESTRNSCECLTDSRWDESRSICTELRTDCSQFSSKPNKNTVLMQANVTRLLTFCSQRLDYTVIHTRDDMGPFFFTQPNPRC